MSGRRVASISNKSWAGIFGRDRVDLRLAGSDKEGNREVTSQRTVRGRRRGVGPLLSVTVILLVGAGFPAQSRGAENPPVPRFEPHILPIFQKNCLQCHDAKTRLAGLSLQTLEDVFQGGKSGPVILPKKPGDSLLLTMVSSGAMPMGGDRLSDGEIALIRRWIEAGAIAENTDISEEHGAAPVTEAEVMAAILGAKCLPCHGRRHQYADLDLRTRAGLLRGGKSGPAMVPQRPDESLLVRRIVAQEMPPPQLQEQFSVRGLTSEELAKLRRWIAAGAPADAEKPLEVRAEEDPLVSDEDRRFWAFQPPQRPAVPEVRQKERVRNPIDAFLLARLEEKGLEWPEEADRLTLLRRAYLDLTGLPPSPEEINAYRTDPGPGAYGRLVDRLLASPRYGERWARYWLDAVGYADSEGGVSTDAFRPHAYRYRDYIIRSLNADKPYDQFLVEQIAGDELFDYKLATEYTPEQIDKLVATGFLRMGPDSTYGTEQNYLPERFDVVATQIQILSSSVMGLTMGCARCHDHKYDPLPQRDFYRLGTILQTAYDPYDWLSPNVECVGVGAQCDDSNTRLLPLLSARERQEIEERNAPIQKEIDELEQLLAQRAAPFREELIARNLSALPAAVREDVRKAFATPEEKRSALAKYLVEKFKPLLEVEQEELEQRFEDFKQQAEKLKKAIEESKKKLKAKPKIRALFDMGGEPTPARILWRGQYTNPGPLLEPGVPSVLSAGLAPYQVERRKWSTETAGRRLALAKWLTQPNHPLTARIMVNRIWQHHFGVGLVATPGNFGRTGSPPSHPQLLDWLAHEFVRQGWSIKAMHQLIMTSTAYRQRSTAAEEVQRVDPSNRLLSRFPLQRLDADALRDSILKVAGRLDTTPFGPADELDVRPDGEVVAKGTRRGYRRSIYLLQRRSTPVTMLETFDAPLLFPNCLKRPHSTVSSQALQLENSELLRASARYMAGRVMDAVGEDIPRQIERVYWLTLTRPPSPEEARTAAAALRDLIREWQRHLESEVPAEPITRKAPWLALASLCHTYLNSAEFLYLN